MKTQPYHWVVITAFLDAVSSFPSLDTTRNKVGSSLFAVSRRNWFVGATSVLAFTSLPDPTRAEESAVVPTMEMKEFTDPEGLFSLRVPKNFYTLRRTQKGDLPDAKTGKGRRGSSIFTAGDMAKAEVVAVERYVYVVEAEFCDVEPPTSNDRSSFEDTQLACCWRKMESSLLETCQPFRQLGNHRRWLLYWYFEGKRKQKSKVSKLWTT